MNEKEKAYSKKYSQKNPPANYTGIEGGGLSGSSGLDSRTAGMAAGESLPGGTPERRSAAAAEGSHGTGGHILECVFPDGRAAAGAGCKTAPGRKGQCGGYGGDRRSFPTECRTAEALAAGERRNEKTAGTVLSPNPEMYDGIPGTVGRS